MSTKNEKKVKEFVKKLPSPNFLTILGIAIILGFLLYIIILLASK